jgi:hypothetical protein
VFLTGRDRDRARDDHINDLDHMIETMDSIQGQTLTRRSKTGLLGSESDLSRSFSVDHAAVLEAYRTDRGPDASEHTPAGTNRQRRTLNVLVPGCEP